jgi:hypothetical protein
MIWHLSQPFVVRLLDLMIHKSSHAHHWSELTLSLSSRVIREMRNNESDGKKNRTADGGERWLARALDVGRVDCWSRRSRLAVKSIRLRLVLELQSARTGSSLATVALL